MIRPGILAPRRSSATTLVKRYLNISGAEFTPNNAITGASSAGFSNQNYQVYDNDWHFESQGSLNYVASRGWNRVKIVTRWERMQTVRGGALDATNLARLITTLDHCQTAGLKASVDLHNYGYYYLDGAETGQTPGTGYRRYLGHADLPYSNFADVWSRLATAIGSHPALEAFALMNEPVPQSGFTATNWKAASQAAVDAIRAVNSNVEIWVSGFNWADTHTWSATNGSPWITDPANNFRYEAHHYWDDEHSGAYAATYNQEITNSVNQGYSAGGNTDAFHTRVLSELHNFTGWLTTNGVKGIVGEFNAPNDGGADQTKWNALLERYLDELDTLQINSAAWSTGEFYSPGSDNLLIYHNNGGSVLSAAYPQAAIHEAHPTFSA